MTSLETHIQVSNLTLIDIPIACRVCMSKIIDNSGIICTQTSIADQILYCTGIDLTKQDGLPNMICKLCSAKLKVAYWFKLSCINAEETFRSLLDNSIKTEPPDKLESKEVCFDDDFDHDFCEDLGQKCNNNRVRKKDNKKKGLSKKVEQEVVAKVIENRCVPCAVTFDNKELLSSHKIEKHKTEFICEVCGKRFVHRASQYSHLKSHYPPEFKCDHCGYDTPHKSDLRKHMRIHVGVKRYVCEYCTMGFFTMSNLYSHIRRRHGGKKNHICPKCDAAFHTAHKLRIHLDSHDNIKRYQCDECHDKFTRRCHWKKHLFKQHGIVVPQARPGRKKINLVINKNMSD